MLLKHAALSARQRSMHWIVLSTLSTAGARKAINFTESQQMKTAWLKHKNTSSQVMHDSYEDMADVLQDQSNCILKQNLNSRTCWAWITDPKKKNTMLLHVVCLTCKGLFLKSSNWRYPLPFNMAHNDCPSGDVSLLSPRNKSLRFWLNFTALTKRQDSDQHKFRYFK